MTTNDVEGIIEEWKNKFPNGLGTLHDVDGQPKNFEDLTYEAIDTLRQALLALQAKTREEVMDIIGKHNARILNEYQKNGHGDETMLWDSIGIATEDTLRELSNKK